MIIARSPLRITLGGGGTDLPSYYHQHGGFLIAAAIDKYVYATVTRPFAPGIFLKYSRLETVERAEQIEHPIIRESLKMLEKGSAQIEITTLADIPAGTGLGSSGSFTTALLKSLFAFERCFLQQDKLAALACEIEMERVGDPIGKQDPYIATYGGITAFHFLGNGMVEVEPIPVSAETLVDLEENLLLFFTGFSREAAKYLKEQNDRTKQLDEITIDSLHEVKNLGLLAKNALLKGNTNLLGELMHQQWEQKKRRAHSVSNPNIDAWYAMGLANGALGGKLVGAGGGGFLLFYAADRKQLRKTMAKIGLQEVRFGFDFEGTKLILNG